jgi:hypothetical protein
MAGSHGVKEAFMIVSFFLTQRRGDAENAEENSCRDNLFLRLCVMRLFESV